MLVQASRVTHANENKTVLRKPHYDLGHKKKLDCQYLIDMLNAIGTYNFVSFICISYEEQINQ